MSKPLEKIINEYPIRGPLGQFRFDKSISFTCFRCGKAKTAKLITTYNGSWDKKLCNGCYGELLSIHNIKAGQNSTDEKAEQLIKVLIKLVDEHTIKEQSIKLNLKYNKAKFLSPSALRFFATSEYIAESLANGPNLDWSPPIISLCKAFELELIERIINPLKEICKEIDFTERDLKDKDFGKVACFCSGKPVKPPELGVINHFVVTAVNSKKRLENSNFLNMGFKKLVNNLPNHNWIIDKNGLSNAIQVLTTDYRNRAAHTDELDAQDYVNCRELVFGNTGIIWELIFSSKKKVMND